MCGNDKTLVTGFNVKEKINLQKPMGINWAEVPKRGRGEGFAKNLAVSSALVLCVVTLRAGALPTMNDMTDVVLAAATDQSLLDEQLGKLSFVNALFPEAVLVFGEHQTSDLVLDISADQVVHAWSEQEPYISCAVPDRQVYSPCGGEVVAVYHGNGDERLVQIMSDDGIACLIGNLQDIHVQTGDYVTSSTLIGTLLPDVSCVIEVRENGCSIDPAPYLSF